MSAQPAMFQDWIQEPLEQGLLSPHQAWRLEWELLVLTDQPWTPGVFEIRQTVGLYHWSPEPQQMQ